MYNTHTISQAHPQLRHKVFIRIPSQSSNSLYISTYHILYHIYYLYPVCATCLSDIPGVVVFIGVVPCEGSCWSGVQMYFLPSLVGLLFGLQ